VGKVELWQIFLHALRLYSVSINPQLPHIHSFIYSYITPCLRFLPEKLTGLQLVKKPLNLWNQNNIASFTRARYLVRTNLVHVSPFHFLKIHFNILSSTPITCE
jgi:hypothetical protein